MEISTELVDEIFLAGKRVVLNTILIHIICRLASFATRPTVYDETPYKMKLMNLKQENLLHDIGDDEESEQGEEEQEEQRHGGKGGAKQKKNGARSRSKSPFPKSHTTSAMTTSTTTTTKPLIVVTGSSGRIGCAVVQSLIESGAFEVRGIDRHEPMIIRRSEGVDYRSLDIVESSDNAILQALEGASGIIHCAGVVALYNAPALVHNDITYATTRLLYLARKAGVTAFVHTSSTVVINNGRLNLNAIPPDSPYEENQLTPWGKAHLQTEKLVREASDDPNDEHSQFFTCSNRLPGLFGLNDKLVVSVIIEGELAVFPSRTDVRVEMLYIKNAAHAHVCALRSLLDRTQRQKAAGQALIITQSIEGETSTNLEFWTRARRTMGIKRSFVILPTWFFYLVASLLEFAYFYFVGIVPKSVVWNLTRPFVNSILHDNTFLGQKEALHAIGYKPVFSNESAFEDMARELREISKKHSNGPNVASHRQLLMQLDHDPKDDIDWEPRPMPKHPSFLRSLFLTMLGPGVSWHEVIMFYIMQAIAYTFGFYVANTNSFTRTQTFFAMMFAGWHLPGAVMSIGPSNKRWFHLGGNLGMFMLLLIICDTCLSVTIAGLVFPVKEDVAVLWIAVSGAILLLGLFIILFLVPLAHQRAYGVMCFFTVAGAQMLAVIPPIQHGMEWLLPLMAFKFFICHGPRHEPYKYEL
jgi:nucleoside-diphosphate-sugar epimerase